MSAPFSFTKGIKVMKIESQSITKTYGINVNLKRCFFDLKSDPFQANRINDFKIENMMINYMKRLMKENDCPGEQFLRLGLNL